MDTKANVKATHPSYKNSCGGQHRWAREATYIGHSGWGKKTITTCNECNAVKVDIETNQSDGTTDVASFVCAPVDHR